MATFLLILEALLSGFLGVVEITIIDLYSRLYFIFKQATEKEGDDEKIEI